MMIGSSLEVIDSGSRINLIDRAKKQLERDVFVKIAEIVADGKPRYIKAFWMTRDRFRDPIVGAISGTSKEVGLSVYLAYLKPEDCLVGDFLYYPFEVTSKELVLRVAQTGSVIGLEYKVFVFRERVIRGDGEEMIQLFERVN